ncbi:MAG: hypothetical protein ABGX26_00365 [Nautiliaceae bacterium]
MGKRKNKIQKIFGKNLVNKPVKKSEEKKTIQEGNSDSIEKLKKDDSSNRKNTCSAENVRKHRKRLKALGFKQIAIYLPPNAYKKLKFLRLHTNKSYADIIEKLIEEEYESFTKREDINFLS